MYPDEFPRNAWYVAARSAEVSHQLLARWILGDPVVLYRTEAGEAVAMVDRCIHRQMPLSMGRLKGDQIECGYHGLTYDTGGRCTRIPGTTAIPDRVRVRAYRLYEEFGLIWIWPGDPALADESLLPDHHWYTDPGWSTAAGTLHMNGRAQLLNENLLDLSHLSFLHPESIGTPEIAEVPIKVAFDDRTVTVRREMTDVPCPPFFTQITDITTTLDRQQIAEYTAPSFHVSTATIKPHGDVDDSRMCNQKVMHAITPETRTSSHYFWSVSRDFAVGDDAVTRYVLSSIEDVFGQDIRALEAIEHIISAWEPSYPIELNIKVDAGPLQSRRILERMIAAERKGQAKAGGPAWSPASDTAARAAAQAWAKRNREQRA